VGINIIATHITCTLAKMIIYTRLSTHERVKSMHTSSVKVSHEPPSLSASTSIHRQRTHTYNQGRRPSSLTTHPKRWVRSTNAKSQNSPHANSVANHRRLCYYSICRTTVVSNAERSAASGGRASRWSCCSVLGAKSAPSARRNFHFRDYRILKGSMLVARCHTASYFIG
jgi:hypothetical protein